MNAFSESSVGAHRYLFIAGFIVLVAFLIYGFWCDHKEPIDMDPVWITSFKKQNLSTEQIDSITHDNGTWYYNGVSTCVGYGDWNDKCPRHENYCEGGKVIGDSDMQAKAVSEAIRNGGQHPMCPLIYKGAD